MDFSLFRESEIIRVNDINDCLTLDKYNTVHFNTTVDFSEDDDCAISTPKLYNNYTMKFKKDEDVSIVTTDNIVSIYAYKTVDIHEIYSDDLYDVVKDLDEYADSDHFKIKNKFSNIFLRTAENEEYSTSIEEKTSLLHIRYTKKYNFKFIDGYLKFQDKNIDKNSISIEYKKYPRDVFKSYGRYKLIETEKEFNDYLSSNMIVDYFCILKLLNTFIDLKIKDEFVKLKLIKLIGSDYDKYSLLKKYSNKLSGNDLGLFVITILEKEDKK